MSVLAIEMSEVYWRGGYRHFFLFALRCSGPRRVRWGWVRTQRTPEGGRSEAVQAPLAGRRISWRSQVKFGYVHLSMGSSSA